MVNNIQQKNNNNKKNYKKYPNKSSYNNNKSILLSTLFNSFLIMSILLQENFIEFKSVYISFGGLLLTALLPLLIISFEVYGKKVSKYILKSSIYGLATVIILLSILKYTTSYVNPFTENGTFKSLSFVLNIKTILAIMISYFIPLLVSIYIFSWLRFKTKGKGLWFRTFCTLIISQIIYILLYYGIMFGTAINENIVLNILKTEIILRLLLTILYVVVIIIIISIIKKVSIIKRKLKFNKGSKKNEKYYGYNAKSKRYTEKNRGFQGKT